MLLAFSVIGFVAALGVDDRRVHFSRHDEGSRWCFGGIILIITHYTNMHVKTYINIQNNPQIMKREVRS